MENDRAQGDSPSGYARSIDLPQAFRNMQSAKHFAVDIGGSLAKVAYMSEVLHMRKRHHSFISTSKEQIPKDEQSKDTPIYEIREQPEPRMRLHFIKFETKYIETCVDFIQEHLLHSKDEPQNKVLKATGGGAFKYKDLLTNKLGVRVDKEDEMCCLIKGCCFMLQHIPNEVFEFHKNSEQPYVFQHLERSSMFPFLLVNIGSGVSVVKVDSEDEFERVGGTSMGGGTFWGLGSLLTKAKGFDELLALAEKGEHRNVDMLVKDIYGGAYHVLGLPGDLTASSFGKTQRDSMGDRNFKESDIAKSLLFMISNDIGQIAALYAKLYGLKKVFFGGYFIRGNPVTMHTISYAINYWSKGEQQALFLRHEGYLGAIGAFLKGAGKDVFKNLTNQDATSWGENYAGSSGLPLRNLNEECDVLELDQLPRALVEFPLLTSGYFPDTEDLTADGSARDYWLTCFEEALERVVRRAIASQESLPDTAERAERFRVKYQLRISVLRKQPGAFGALTVRSLLDTREQCLNEFGFSDPYAKVKQEENEAALKLLSRRLSSLDKMSWNDRQFALVEGLLTGNVFDWGAKEVVKIMQKGELDFESAKEKLQERPWLRDDLDAWIERLQGPPHKLAVVFVDNSGIDIILGVFPFVRELLARGTHVVLAANSHPALNDVMFSELDILVEGVAEICPIIRSAVQDGRLVPMESGSGSPCLDLRRVDSELARKCQQADLVVIEGMGRCIHTNYEAKFSCESLKLAVIKNRWLAKRLGGDMYSVVFQYETPAESVIDDAEKSNMD